MLGNQRRPVRTIHPTLDYLPGENRLANCSDFEEFRVRVIDILGQLTAEEVKRLNIYFEANRPRLGEQPMRWALFSWETDPHCQYR